MAITDTIQKARERNVDDGRIIEEIIKANPEKAETFRQAQQRGAPSTKILDEIISQNSQVRQAIIGEKPAKAGLQSFLERFKLSFGGEEAKEQIKTIEEAQGTRGKFDIGDIADVAGSAIPLATGVLGAIGGTFAGGPVGTAAGGAIGVGAGEAVKRTIGQALGVRKDVTPIQEVTGPAGKALETFVGGKVLGFAGRRIRDVYKGAKDLLSKKTVQQIMDTAEENLGKLSDAERAIYYSAKNKAITLKSTVERQNLALNTRKQIVKLQDEAKELSAKMATASRDEVLRIRPKIISALGRQSQEYRRLVEKELENFKDLQVLPREIQSFVEKRFANNPEAITNVMSRLGISDDITSKSVMELYKQSVSLGQEIGTAAKKGSRVFTPDEKVTDDAISTLVDFLKTKGVDLTNARQFWAQYAPIRNQLISEAKPFVQAETLTSGFANRLVKVAQGKDPNNEIFVSEVEKLVGPIGTEVRQLAQQLSAKQKETFATRLEAEAKRAGIQLATQAERIALGESKAQATLTAEQRKNLLRLIRYTLYAVGVGYGAVRAGELIFD